MADRIIHMITAACKQFASRGGRIRSLHQLPAGALYELDARTIRMFGANITIGEYGNKWVYDGVHPELIIVVMLVRRGYVATLHPEFRVYNPRAMGERIFEHRLDPSEQKIDRHLRRLYRHLRAKRTH